MVAIHFPPLKALKPAAFKLLIYLLHRAEETGTDQWCMTLVDLAWESGLQSEGVQRFPGKPHGNDGQLRNALQELVEKGYVEKTGRRGRHPNTYRLRRLPSVEENLL